MRWSIVLTVSVAFAVFQGTGRADTYTATISCLPGSGSVTNSGSAPQLATAECITGTGLIAYANANVSSSYGFLGIDAMLTPGFGRRSWGYNCGIQLDCIWSANSRPEH